MSLEWMPHLNASLNAASGVLLLAGYSCIRMRKIKAHATFMISAAFVSAVFLGCYLYYHFHTGEKTTEGIKAIAPTLRKVYLGMLLSHVLLAVVVLPMIVITLTLAARRRFASHMRIARPTFLIWLYVSATGVLVYWMLYHLFPGMKPG